MIPSPPPKACLFLVVAEEGCRLLLRPEMSSEALVTLPVGSVFQGLRGVAEEYLEVMFEGKVAYVLLRGSPRPLSITPALSSRSYKLGKEAVAEAKLEKGRWRYICVNEPGVGVRNKPTISDSARVNVDLRFKEVIWVEERISVQSSELSGVLFLKIASNQGWVFSSKGGLEIMHEFVPLPIASGYKLNPDKEASVRCFAHCRQGERVLVRDAPIRMAEIVAEIPMGEALTACSRWKVHGGEWLELVHPTGWVSVYEEEHGSPKAGTVEQVAFASPEQEFAAARPEIAFSKPSMQKGKLVLPSLPKGKGMKKTNVIKGTGLL